MYPQATRLITCDIHTDIEDKWEDFVDGGNGCLYGLPLYARRVVEYNVEDKSVKEIGPDLGDDGAMHCAMYWNGIKANNGSIYCMPLNTKDFLKIIPGEGKNAEVKMLHIREQEIPSGDWMTGALANDGCIYYFPGVGCRGRILKLDPSDGDSLSLVGEEIDKDFTAALLANDGYIYGISIGRIIKFNPTDHSVSSIGDVFEEPYRWAGAVLAEDENIYTGNQRGQILKIDTTQNNWKIIGNKIYKERRGRGWGRPVLGADKCIYFPPLCHDRVLKYNSSTGNVSLIGESYGKKMSKWEGAALASDGYIYCIPCCANEILQIDSRHINEKVLDIIDDIYEGNVGYAANQYGQIFKIDIANKIWQLLGKEYVMEAVRGVLCLVPISALIFLLYLTIKF